MPILYTCFHAQVDTDVVLCYLKGAGESKVHLGLIQIERPRDIKILDNVSFYFNNVECAVVM